MKKTFLTPTEYYYAPDYDRYLKRENGIFYCIVNGEERASTYLACIQMGSIYVEDITKEEYDLHLA